MVWLAVLVLIVGVALGAGGFFLLDRGGGSAATGAAPEANKPLYQCPMHPTITSDHPGDCPICGMKLVEVKQDASVPEAATTGAEHRILFYRSPMDPTVTSPAPRQDEMGMDYVPVYADEVAGGGTESVPGLATVTIDPARQQLIGLRTAPVTRGDVAGSWQTIGRVQVDQTRVRKTNVKVEGYIERLFVDFVGMPVHQGQPLFSLYSPSLVAAENEYLLARRTKDALAARGAAADNGEALLAAARRKLEYWDVPTAEVERLEQTGQPAKSLTFVSPIAGVVTAKNVVEGARVNPGDTPFEITDLGVVWVMADAYESDLPRLQVGMPATFTVRAYADRPFTGEIAFIDPLLDARTRTTKVHLHLRNPDGILKPEMFGDVVLTGTSREGLQIPADAVIRSGETDVVFVALGDGKFAPRVVQLGARSGDQVEVTGGLDEGQDVVVRANFLVDSESQLRSSLAAIGGKSP
ncbi:MAG: efflux RND transporter periplasmic adaptor subunit [bacterium]|nr:efflux RND transporter periplasmic adaptor subunit [bacterium]